MKNLLLFANIALINSFSFGQKVTINFQDVRNTNGQIIMSIYETEQQFKDEKPSRYVHYDKVGLKDSKKTVTVQLKPGTYGLSFLDDEDSNNKMTWKLGVYPKEGVGFSDFKFKGMSKPKFSDFQFDLKEDKSINVPFRYF